MDKSQTTLFFLYLIFSSFALISCAPKPQDDDDAAPEDVIPKLINQTLDYNSVVGHFKDFFMYLPVMFTTLRETMSGFPKFAEGVRILTSGQSTTNGGGEDCKCKPTSRQDGNDISRNDLLQ